jgi:GntR family transcriptional repressor for pyruvate dehydrogenase complex
MARIAKPQRINLTRQCVTSIQRYIATNGLGSGDKLPTLQEWTEMLGVSIVVVREAFRSLEALGLVDIQHGRGIYIQGVEETDLLDLLAFTRSLDSFSLEEVIEGRAMLELVVLESCIARAGDAEIAELAGILAQMREDPPLPGTDSDLHKLFHQAMLKATGDRLLFNVGMPLLNTFWALGNNGSLQLPPEAMELDMVAAHADYLTAIQDRDLSRTRILVDRHLLGLCSRYQVFPYVELVHQADAPSPDQGVSADVS